MTWSILAASVWTEQGGPPEPELLPPDLRSRVGRLTRLAAHVLGDLKQRSTFDLRRVPLVLGTARGDVASASRCVANAGIETEPFALEQPGLAELPAALDAAGGRDGASLVVSAGGQTVPMALLEAQLQTDAEHPDAVVVFVEDATPSGLLVDAHGALAVALHLRSGRHDHAPEVGRPRWQARPPAPSKLPAALACNPCAPALWLAEVRSAGVLRLDARAIPSAYAWCVTVSGPTGVSFTRGRLRG
jgi:hypothetical protein